MFSSCGVMNCLVPEANENTLLQQEAVQTPEKEGSVNVQEVSKVIIATKM